MNAVGSRDRAAALAGVGAGVVLVAVTIWTATTGDLTTWQWVGALVALGLGMFCFSSGLTRLRRTRGGS